MDKIINILLLVIIFVFDPLAISLVVAANFAFDIANRKNLYGEFEDELFEDNNPVEDITDKLEDYDEEDERRMDIIGTNGNDGEHYEEVKSKEPPKKDWKVVVEGEPPQPQKILQKGPSEHRVLFSDGSERKVPKDDDIIRYL